MLKWKQYLSLQQIYSRQNITEQNLKSKQGNIRLTILVSFLNEV